MNEIQFFIEKNYDKNRKWKPRYITQDINGLAIVCNSKQISSVELCHILSDLYHIIMLKGILGKYNKVYFFMPLINPKDKLVYILLESVVYMLIDEYGYEVIWNSKELKININTQGFAHSALAGLVSRNPITKERFKKRYMFSIDKNHYRRVIKSDGDLMDTSTMLSEIKTFLFRFDVPDEFKSTCAKIVTELADNAKEHGKADCLVDIDVTEPRFMLSSSDLSEDNFYSINVVVLNFSNMNLGDEIKQKIKKHQYGKSQRYETVQTAFDYHSCHFNKRYTEDDFFNITAFQEKISGRINETISGGTGLAELVKSLQDYAYNDYCYAMTGDKGLLLKKELLFFNEEKWVGFNEDNNYVCDIPSKEAVLRSNTYLPGTGYNFMFVFKENKNEIN
ncbi:MAG: hypothetical protein PHW34_12790 [Hespellia sp.]|nr:hypothetical protein [Hespellia sp.]